MFKSFKAKAEDRFFPEKSLPSFVQRSLVATVLLFLFLLPVQAGHSAPKLLFRIHIQTTGEGLSGQEAMPVTLAHPAQNIIVRVLPEITESEIISVQEETTGTRFYFSHAGKVSLDAFTAQDQGRIMVVLLNNEVIYAPVIDEQINTGQLLIPVKFKPDVLKNLEEIAQRNTKENNRI